MATLDTFTPTTGIPNGNNSNFLDELLATLQGGLTASNVSSTYCCPSCTNTNGEQVYFLADLPMAGQLLNAMGYTKKGDILTCCMNTVAQLTSPNYAAFAAKEYVFSPCVNNFLDCYNELSARLGKDCCTTLEAKGIVEYNTLTGTNTGSQICLILQYLLSVNPSLSESELCEAFSKLLELGIVIRCRDGKVIITDGCTYMDEVLPCTCWEVTVATNRLVDITSDCACPGPAVTVPVFGNGNEAYFCGRNVTSNGSIKDVVITNLGIPCGECDLYVPCYCYSLTYNDSNLSDTDYIDCEGNPQVLVPDVQGTYKICSRTTPVPQTVSDKPAIITQLGLCDQFPECSEATCFCWIIEEAVQDCVVETTCQGVTTSTTLPWNGIYVLCSETAPTSSCAIDPVKTKTCDPDDPCFNVEACLCFRIVTTIESNITTYCGTGSTVYDFVPAGTYNFCSNGNIECTDPNASLTLIGADCIRCILILPTKCYDVVIPISAGSVPVSYATAGGTVMTSVLAPGIYGVCSSSLPIASSTDPDIIINAAGSCTECKNIVGCYCWEFTWAPTINRPSVDITTYCDDTYVTTTYTVATTTIIQSTVEPLATVPIVFNQVGFWNPETLTCEPI